MFAYVSDFVLVVAVVVVGVIGDGLFVVVVVVEGVRGDREGGEVGLINPGKLANTRGGFVDASWSRAPKSPEDLVFFTLFKAIAVSALCGTVWRVWCDAGAEGKACQWYANTWRRRVALCEAAWSGSGQPSTSIELSRRFGGCLLVGESRPGQVPDITGY